MISRDAVIEEQPGTNYSDKWKNADQKKVDKIFNKRKMDTLKNGTNVFVDMTNMSRKSRRKILSQAGNDFYKKAIVFVPSLNEIVKRNNTRSKKEGKFIPDEVYEKMIKSFYPPMYDEGFDEIEYKF